MKRYVKEFANDILMANNPRVRSGELQHPGRVDIITIMRHCERGRISDKEAVRAILQIDQNCIGVSWSAA